MMFFALSINYKAFWVTTVLINIIFCLEIVFTVSNSVHQFFNFNLPFLWHGNRICPQMCPMLASHYLIVICMYVHTYHRCSRLLAFFSLTCYWMIYSLCLSKERVEYYLGYKTYFFKIANILGTYVNVCGILKFRFSKKATKLWS